MQGQSLGSVEYGDVFYFMVSNRDSNGAQLASFTPEYFDVRSNKTGALILSDQPLRLADTDSELWRGSISTRDTDTDATGPFEPGETYTIVIKDDTTDNPITAPPTIFQLYSFTVTGAYSARLKRLLGLDGENFLVDNFQYDNGNNATSFRVRVFDTAANASAATIGIQDASLPETGEKYFYTVTQTFSVGKNLRASHLSVLAGGELANEVEKGQ